MVNPERAAARLRRLRETIELLEEVRGEGKKAYLADRLAEAAKQRNLLAHLYLEIDDEKVFESLSNLDDLRRFAAFVEEQLD